MSVGENEERRTYTVFSLFKLASLALTPDQHLLIRTNFGDRLNLDVQACCKLLHVLIREYYNSRLFNPLGHRRNMTRCLKYLDFTNFKICNTAVKFGHIDCLKMAHEIGFPLHKVYKNVYYDEHKMKDIDIDNIYHYWSPGLCSIAAFFGNLACLEYAHQQGIPWDQSTCTAAAQGGNMDCLKFAIENGCPLDGPMSTKAAATVGNIAELIYLKENQCSWSEITCAAAAKGGHLKCLMYLRAHGCPWNLSVCSQAILNGHFECLQFAVENGCPIERSESEINVAASVGNLSTLKYLHQQGCSWSVKTCANAAKNGHLECLMYARANGCPWDSTVFTNSVFMVYQMICTEYETLGHNFQRENEQMCIKAMKKQPECINYAWKNGCPWREGSCMAGSGDGRMDCLLAEPDHVCEWDEKQFNGYAAILRQTRQITPEQITFLLIKCLLFPTGVYDI